MSDSKIGNLKLSYKESNNLHLILNPTEKCNFRCTYCYENFDIGKMTFNVVNGVKNYISKQAPLLDHLNITWFGGEPTLAVDIIKNISEHVIRETSKFQHCKYSADMNTNGFLLYKDVFLELLSLGIRGFQISLDGDEQNHNITRVQANGHGSYSQILDNLANIASLSKEDYQFEIILRIHAHPNNISGIETLLYHLSTLIKGDDRFFLFYKEVGHLGSLNDEYFPVFMGDHNYYETFIKLCKSLGLQSIGNDKMPYCYASNPNSFVIRPNGSIAKCTVGFDDFGNHVGSLSENGELNIQKNKFQPWLHGMIANIDEFKYCPKEYVNSLPNSSQL
ncbi:radical SAM protein [Candidatus Albibeggiatoa sp. nov. NOAA]|uniref:radical SAM protein n=1 Tax=Candidatus Albibeggiatoa sp. nov. NOAA TaxID=3162724 RepID=UPI0032F3DC37|nr:radical SAM protein [Thiotrichaceae bacterium]